MPRRRPRARYSTRSPGFRERRDHCSLRSVARNGCSVGAEADRNAIARPPSRLHPMAYDPRTHPVSGVAHDDPGGRHAAPRTYRLHQPGDLCPHQSIRHGRTGDPPHPDAVASEQSAARLGRRALFERRPLRSRYSRANAVAFDALLHALHVDDRHRDLTIVSRQTIEQPRFAVWSMKYVAAAEDVKPLLASFGLRHVDPYRFDDEQVVAMAALMQQRPAMVESGMPPGQDTTPGAANHRRTDATTLARRAFTLSVIALLLAMLTRRHGLPQ